MDIGLYGIAGLYNFGCEAIVRGADCLFRKVVPGCSITYWSYRPHEDSAQISDTDIKIKSVARRDGFPLRALGRVQKLLGCEKRVMRFDSDRILENEDVLVSIGGDLYTIPNHDLAHRKYQYYSSQVQFDQRCMSLGKPLIIYGASIGPFGDFEKAVKYYSDHLRSVNLIMAREARSVDYLRTIGVSENTVFAPDPIFSLEKPWAKAGARSGTIGLNFSPLSFREINGTDDGAAKQMANLISDLVVSMHKDVMLIPHVISPFEGDNDEVFQEAICAYLPDGVRQHVQMTHPKSLYEACDLIMECEVVAGARMHFCLNAITSGVPALFLSYSEKSIGMSRLVYGNDRWIASVDNSGLIKQKLLGLLQEHSQIELELHKTVNLLKELSVSPNVADRLRRAISQSVCG